MFLSFCGKVPRNEGAAFVAPNATVQGDVILKAGSTVWYGAVLRGDDGQLIIGENSNVQDNAVLHCDVGGAVTLGRNVTVGHSALVHGCTVGDGSLIGMHATLLNHCVVGKNCIIGAGALVPEGHQAGKRGPDRGQPAQRRPLRRARQASRRRAYQGLTLCRFYSFLPYFFVFPPKSRHFN